MKLRWDLNTRKLNIIFNYDKKGFRVRNSNRIKNIVEKIIIEAGLKPEKISIVFSSDRKILKINKEFLNHNYFTDTITFDYSAGRIVNGEIYISIDRIKRNAKKYNVQIEEEVKRVIFHSILHLCGYTDASEVEKSIMRVMENKYIKEFGEEWILNMI